MFWKQRIKVGDTFSVSKTVSESDVYLYAGITGDFHPNHINKEYASKKSFKFRVVHGALLVGFFSATTSQLRDILEPPGYLAQEFNIKFIKPVYFGDTIKTELTVSEIIEERRKIILDSKIINQDGDICAIGSSIIKVIRENN